MRKFSRAVTDSEATVRFDREKQPGVSNLLEIFAAIKGKDTEELEREFAGVGYGDFKKAVAQAVLTELGPIKAEYSRLRSDEEYLDRVLQHGRERVSDEARSKLIELKQTIGLL